MGLMGTSAHWYQRSSLRSSIEYNDRSTRRRNQLGTVVCLLHSHLLPVLILTNHLPLIIKLLDFDFLALRLLLSDTLRLMVLLLFGRWLSEDGLEPLAIGSRLSYITSFEGKTYNMGYIELLEINVHGRALLGDLFG